MYVEEVNVHDSVYNMKCVYVIYLKHCVRTTSTLTNQSLWYI